METQKVKITVKPGGPALVEGGAIVIDKNGVETIKTETFALCRCGHSQNKPFCDGAHKKTEFDK